MIIKDDEAVKRLSSPINLMNQLKNLSSPNKRQSAMGLFGIGRTAAPEIKKIDIESPRISTFNPFESKHSETHLIVTQLAAALPVPTPTNIPDTTLDSILENTDSQIKLGLAHDNALSLLNNSVKLLSEKLDDVRADKLPAVIASASKVVESIRRERSESSKNGKDREVHYHFYTPQQKKVSDYEVIEVQ